MLIGELQKNSTERIRVSTEIYKGHEFIDVRIYFDEGSGELKPTKKGIAITPEKVGVLIDLLKKAIGREDDKCEK